MNAKERDRRRFLKEGAALAGLAVGAVRSVSGQRRGYQEPEINERFRPYGERSRFEKSVRTPGIGKPLRGFAPLAPLQDQTGILTPAPLHMEHSHGYDPPDIDPRQHRLLIHGLVDRPLSFTLEELKLLPSVFGTYFIECNSNTNYRGFDNYLAHMQTVQETHGWVSCSEWAGVPLSVLLREAGVQRGASWLVAEGADEGKTQRSIPLEKAMKDVIVAYGQNGEAVRPEQGYPLRLVVPGFEGLFQIKWLRRIQVVDQPTMAFMEVARYVDFRPDGKSRWFRFEMGPKSVITRPSGGQRLPGRGFIEITGLAWSGGGAVRRVEVSTDGGRSWKDAQIQEPALPFAFTRFVSPWTWDGEEAVLQSRCTDEVGQVQPTLAEFSRIWGVNVEYWNTTAGGHFNCIQPWKVTREGSVHNAIRL